MTFKDLSNIIRKRKERLLVEQQEHEEKEITEAEALINSLRANRDKAINEREDKWKKENPGKEFYSRTDEDNKRDCKLDEWFYDFFMRIHNKSPEQRYQEEKNPSHGFGHKSKLHGLVGDNTYVDPCVPGCTFYEPTGRLTDLDILKDYEGFDRYDEVLKAWHEMQPEM
jgi:hypothetical protein